jgi:ribose 5-phosphate isomerase A
MSSAERALDYVADGAVIGLGTGRAATAFVHALGERVRAGLQVRGVPTSIASARLATELGIPLTSLDEVSTVDVAVDGADEVDPHGNLIKGLGGALVREKIVASAARMFVVLVGPEKLVPVLGSHGVLPVEVVPFAAGYVARRIAQLGLETVPRRHNNQLFQSDNGNPILDCRVPLLEPATAWESKLRAIPGIVGTGLFLDMQPIVLVDRPGGTELRVTASPRSQA